MLNTEIYRGKSGEVSLQASRNICPSILVPAHIGMLGSSKSARKYPFLNFPTRTIEPEFRRLPIDQGRRPQACTEPAQLRARVCPQDLQQQDKPHRRWSGRKNHQVNSQKAPGTTIYTRDVRDAADVGHLYGQPRSATACFVS